MSHRPPARVSRNAVLAVAALGALIPLSVPAAVEPSSGQPCIHGSHTGHRRR
jgi:hypothetical protein